MRRPVPIRLTPQTAEARTRAIAKLDDRVLWRNRTRRTSRPVALPIETVGHALQRAAAENA